MSAQVPEKLPEEFAPTGPKLSRFPVLPAPPIRPHLFPDEARFALRLSILSGCTELAAWAWVAGAGGRPAALAWGALRLLRPLWARLGTRIPRPAVALVLLCAAVAGAAASLVTLGRLFSVGLVAMALPALSDLCASCAGDSITVERRSAAFAWLDMAQGLGAAVGIALGLALPGPALLGGALALFVGSVGVPDLRDRGTPRSSWPMAARVHVLRSPLGLWLAPLAFACGVFGMLARAPVQPWAAVLWLLAGMALAARVEPRMPNAAVLPRLAALAAALGWFFPGLRLLGLGAMFAAIPAAVARGAGEMERPVASSLLWSALAAGAALGSVL
jgi:hypothetical protein